MAGQNYLKMEEQARALFLKEDQPKMIRIWELDADENYLYPVYFSAPVRIDRRTAVLTLPEAGVAGRPQSAKDDISDAGRPKSAKDDISDAGRPQSAKDDISDAGRPQSAEGGHGKDIGTSGGTNKSFSADCNTGRTIVADDSDPYHKTGPTVNDSLVLFDILTRGELKEGPNGINIVRPAAAGSWASVSELGGVIGAGHDRTLRNEPQAARFAGQCDRLASACEALGGVRESKADVGYAIPVFRDLRILFQFWDADDEFPASIKYLFDRNALSFMHYETLWYLMNCTYRRIAQEFDKL